MAQPEWYAELQKAFQDVGGIFETCCERWADGKDAQEAFSIVGTRDSDFKPPEIASSASCWRFQKAVEFGVHQSDQGES